MLFIDLCLRRCVKSCAGDSIRDHLVRQFMEAHDEGIDAYSAEKLTTGRSCHPLFRAKPRLQKPRQR
jgi:hypothetical protein